MESVLNFWALVLFFVGVAMLAMDPGYPGGTCTLVSSLVERQEADAGDAGDVGFYLLLKANFTCRDASTGASLNVSRSRRGRVGDSRPPPHFETLVPICGIRPNGSLRPVQSSAALGYQYYSTSTGRMVYSDWSRPCATDLGKHGALFASLGLLASAVTLCLCDSVPM